MNLERTKYRRVLAMSFRTLPDIGDLLAALAATIRRRTENVQQIAEAKESSGEFTDDWLVEEGVQVDETLGLGFVTGQLFITGAVPACQRMHRFHAFQSSIAGNGSLLPIGRLSGDKRQLLSRKNPIVGATGVSAVTAVNALANYFKHRDEWPNEWNDLGPNQKDTALILKDLGLLSDRDGVIVRNGDFRDAFKLLLGHDQYYLLGELKEKILDPWAGDLRKEYEEEIKNLGLLD